MVLSDCELIEAECMFLLIDTGIVSDELSQEFMDCIFYTNYEMYVFLNWLLTRWVLLRKHKFHLPRRRHNKLTLTNLIYGDST